MNSFRQLFKGLRVEVRCARFLSDFEAARRRHVAFQPHVGIASVLGVLADDGPQRYADRDALTLALITERQRTPSRLWATALLVAYFPMLSRLRHRIWGDTLSRQDIDQLVVTCFLGVIDEYPVDRHLDRTALRLRQRTERRVFQSIRREQRTLQQLTPVADAQLVDALTETWPEMPDDDAPGPRNAIDAADAVALLVERVGDRLDGETFDLITATLVCGRRIPSFVERLHPALSSDEKTRTYQRIKRRHSRVLSRLRSEFDPLRCPCAEGPGLCEDSGQAPRKEGDR